MNINTNDVISYITIVLNRYNKENKLLDKVGCDELLKSLILYNELSDYIVNIKYVNTVDYNMSYSYFDKTININNNFINSIDKSDKKLLDILNIHDEIIITNLDILHALLHEIMHAKQYKLIDNSSDEFVKNILRKSLAAQSYKHNKEEAIKYAEATKEYKLYSIMPSEINAEVNAIKQTRLIIDRLNIPNKYKYLKLYDITLNLFQIRSYIKKTFRVISPMEIFIKIRHKYIKEDITLNKKDVYKYNLEDRLSYGLPIKKYEYVNLDNEINNSLKDMIK